MAAMKVAHNLSDDAVKLVPMLATGDKIQDRPLADIGGKALWTKELERALIDDQIDIAVHSMKDVETWRPDIFVISAMLPRADVHDRLIGAASLDDLKQGARVGTSSPRRAAQVQRARPDLQIVPLRGNVATRLAHIDAGEADATLLAAAGLDRLDMTEVGTELSLDAFLPAAVSHWATVSCSHAADLRQAAAVAAEAGSVRLTAAASLFVDTDRNAAIWHDSRAERNCM